MITYQKCICYVDRFSCVDYGQLFDIKQNLKIHIYRYCFFSRPKELCNIGFLTLSQVN